MFSKGMNIRWNKSTLENSISGSIDSSMAAKEYLTDGVYSGHRCPVKKIAAPICIVTSGAILVRSNCHRFKSLVDGIIIIAFIAVKIAVIIYGMFICGFRDSIIIKVGIIIIRLKKQLVILGGINDNLGTYLKFLNRDRHCFEIRHHVRGNFSLSSS